MKAILYIPVFLIVLFSCKKDDMDMLSADDAMASITGPWRLIEVEKGLATGQTSWAPVAAGKGDTLSFRSDGVVLDGESKPICCGPNTLIINGAVMPVKPQQPLAPNPACALINCVGCTTWELQFVENELIVTICNSQRMKYVR
ncbi:hypothetical protein [Dyadobacter bucti]|uniref:hypothetical protein n=1 Tax=Dyadobacter bucti TaxID=2572203 RepID=UPI001109331F|nr:hypothetical protein [Dyadobacter bucti]